MNNFTAVALPQKQKRRTQPLGKTSDVSPLCYGRRTYTLISLEFYCKTADLSIRILIFDCNFF